MEDVDCDYIFYADESGDHSLTSIDPTYPVFALSLCAFKKTTYCDRVVPKFQAFKFRYFGHDAVVLHEHDIRKQQGPFAILADSRIRGAFLTDLSTCIESSPFRIFASVILKSDLKMDLFPENPYVLSLQVCLEQAFSFLASRKQSGRRVFFIFEKRGRKEDANLELEFRRITAGQNSTARPFHGFQIFFSDKRTNSTGMQIADLSARPLGLSVFRAGQTNQAFDLIEGKIYRGKRVQHLRPGLFVP